MTLPEIQTALEQKHRAFTNYIDTLTEEEFMYSYTGKWTAGQQLHHIYLSVKALVRGLQMPKLLLWYKFGRANRPSKTYDALVEKYLTKLNAGGLAPSPFVPPAIAYSSKTELENKLHSMVSQLSKCAGKYSEAQLDKYIMPHPLLGRQTIREMLYFTIYHVEHHQQLTQRNLQNK